MLKETLRLNSPCFPFTHSVKPLSLVSVTYTLNAVIRFLGFPYLLEVHRPKYIVTHDDYYAVVHLNQWFGYIIRHVTCDIKKLHVNRVDCNSRNKLLLFLLNATHKAVI